MSSTQPASRVAEPGPGSARAAFYERIGGLSMAPLWEVMESLVTPNPAAPLRPAHWAWREVRPHLLESTALITAREAERRVLVLENPGLPGSSRITTSLYAGLQIVMPGEIAPAHRHTQCALRYVVEGEGGYTTVNGEKTPMAPGDFIITPSWAWHDHGNEGTGPVVWLDGLDIPIVQLFNAGFAQRHESEAQMPAATPGVTDAKFGRGLLPVDARPDQPASPLFRYPYERAREALAGWARGEDPHPYEGYRLRYANPLNGRDAIPTMTTFAQLLPAGFSTGWRRQTDATVYCVREGAGRTEVGEESFAWEPGDVFVVPGWRWHRHQASSESVLFSFSDRGVQELLALWRSEDRT